MRTKKTLLAIGTVLALCAVIACTGGQLPGGGRYVEFTIGGQTFTLGWGSAGIFFIRAGADPIRGGVRITNLLGGQTPADRPTTAQIGLKPTTGVRVERLDVGKAIESYQVITGEFDCVVYIGGVNMENPCDDGTQVGTFEITSSATGVTVDPETLDLPQAAFDDVLTGDFTICVEVSGNADATVTIGEMDVTFGETEGGSATFNFRNDDVENIHFLLPGETFDAANRVSPGQTRTAILEGVTIGQSITIQAGRNGTVLDSTSCPTITGANYTATVVWDGFAVTCEAEQGAGGTLQVPLDFGGDAVELTATLSGVDYSFRGALLEDNSPDAPFVGAQTELSVSLAALGLQYVDTIYLATQSAWSFDLPNGVTVATVTCDYVEGGSSTTLDLVMGSTTAEWAWENPSIADVFGQTPPHTMPTPLTSAPTTQDADEEYLAHNYPASVRPDTSRTLSSISLELVDANALVGTRLPENSEPTWLGAALMAITLEGPAGTPTVGPDEDECTFDSDCDPGEECVDGECQETQADGTTGPKGTVSSTFDTDREEWRVVGDAEGGGGDAEHSATGGNPGGHIHADDDAAGGTWYWQAPAKFYGDFSNAYGQALTYDIKQSSTSSQYDWYEIILDGGGIILVYDYGDFADNPGNHPGTDWTPYSVTLSETAGWLRHNGDPLADEDTAAATQTDMTTVLSDLTQVRIRGEFVVGFDAGDLDNVVLNAD